MSQARNLGAVGRDDVVSAIIVDAYTVPAHLVDDLSDENSVSAMARAEKPDGRRHQAARVWAQQRRLVEQAERQALALNAQHSQSAPFRVRERA